MTEVEQQETTTATPRALPAMDPRVETGPVKFGDDWTGAFIRGDNAMWYAHNLSRALREVTDQTTRIALKGLLADLSWCRESGGTS